jgi:hypothetical protein
MQKNHASVFFILMLLFLSIGVESNAQKVYLTGFVKELGSADAVANARVYNPNAKTGTYTNAKGHFFLWASVGDSIKIMAKSFQPITIFCKGYSRDSSYYLLSDPSYVTQLDEVTVYGKNTQQMRREIQDLLSKPKADQGFDLGSAISTGGSGGQGGAGLSISAFYDYFSKSGKDHRKAATLAEESKYRYYAEWRLNYKFINRLTGLKINDYQAFIDYMQLDNDYVLRASDYELNATIISYFNTYKSRIKNKPTAQ